MLKLKNIIQNNIWLTKLWQSRFPTFIIVGILNTAVGYLLFSFFLFLGLHYVIAVLVATILSVFFNFISTGRLVFKNSNNNLIIKFIIVYGVSYFINISLIKLISFVIPNLYIAGAIATLCMPIFNFIFLKKYVFSGVSYETN